MNPRQRRLRRQRRKTRVRDAESARLELVALKRAADQIIARSQKPIAGAGSRLAAMLTGQGVKV